MTTVLTKPAKTFAQMVAGQGTRGAARNIARSFSGGNAGNGEALMGPYQSRLFIESQEFLWRQMGVPGVTKEEAFRGEVDLNFLRSTSMEETMRYNSRYY